MNTEIIKLFPPTNIKQQSNNNFTYHDSFTDKQQQLKPTQQLNATTSFPIDKNIAEEQDRVTRWTRLLMDKAETQLQREQCKLKLEEKEIEKHCTFQPEINENSKVILKEQSMNSVQVGQRLYEDASQKAVKLEKLQQEQQDSIYYSFHPNVIPNLKGEKAAEKPLFERLDKVIKEKHEMIIKLKEKSDNQSGVTFQPTINQKSVKIAEKLTQVQQLDISERLLQNGQNQEIKKQQQFNEYQNNIMKGCPFAPIINPISEEINDINDESSEQKQNNWIKQYQIADQLKEKLEKKVKDILNEQQITFNPSINKISEYLVEIDEEKAMESQEEKVRRLAIKDYQKKKELQKQIEEDYYKQFEFKPRINEVSKVIGKKKNINDLAYNKESENHKKMLQEKYEQEKHDQFNYEPSVLQNPKYSHIESRYKCGKAMQGIKEQQEAKKMKIEQLQKDLEYKQLQDCTFQPILVANNYLDTQFIPNNIEVKGMDKIIEKRERIKQKKLEEQKREEEVFNRRDKYNYKKENKFTRPQPFKLSKGNQKTIKELMIESLEEQKAICTFQPLINNKKKIIDNSELIV